MACIRDLKKKKLGDSYMFYETIILPYLLFLLSGKPRLEQVLLN